MSFASSFISPAVDNHAFFYSAVILQWKSNIFQKNNMDCKTKRDVFLPIVFVDILFLFSYLTFFMF